MGHKILVQTGDLIEYEKKGWEPPAEIQGYQRDPENKWRFLSIWPKCKFRLPGFTSLMCGKIKARPRCGCLGCPLVSQIVTLEDCQKCTLKVE